MCVDELYMHALVINQSMTHQLPTVLQCKGLMIKYCVFFFPLEGNIEDNNPFYLPASHEEEIYVQLDNQKINKIERCQIE